MKLFKYGISLNRLKEDDIELVRKWRNSRKINQFMEYREEITPEMQKNGSNPSTTMRTSTSLLNTKAKRSA
ncbi:MAG: hypothetical protein U5Q03_16975 [Bacteroidota bacterium]|nr:hypothetical protein [Bacteroidota bacterium]